MISDKQKAMSIKQQAPKTFLNYAFRVLLRSEAARV